MKDTEGQKSSIQIFFIFNESHPWYKYSNVKQPLRCKANEWKIGMTIIRKNQLAAVFRDKPEMVNRLPEWMLSGPQIESYQRMEDLAIVEIAGRDSVAAAVRAVAESAYGNLLPVYVYTGSEHGSWESVEEAVNRLTRRLPESLIHPLLVIGSPGFWRALNGRYAAELINVFGHYTPCTGCHLYLHAIRLPLSRTLGNVPIIAGERKSHGGSIKINQISEVLDFYVRFAASFGIRLDLPLAEITDDSIIEAILNIPWKRDKDQLGCVLSGNYKNVSGDCCINATDVTLFFNRFAEPVANAVIHEYLENRLPDHDGIAARVMDQLVREKDAPILSTPRKSGMADRKR